MHEGIERECSSSDQQPLLSGLAVLVTMSAVKSKFLTMCLKTPERGFTLRHDFTTLLVFA